MHTASAAHVVIERRFKDGAKNSQGNLRPIEIVDGVVEKELFNFRREVGEADFVSKKPAGDFSDDCAGFSRKFVFD